MPRTRVPHALHMRELKYGEGSEAERESVAEALRESDRLPEALLLFERHVEHPMVARLVRTAVETGRGFLLLSARRIGAAVTDDDLRACAAAAESKGRWMEARQCHRALGDDAALVRISPNLPPALAVAPPPPPPLTETRGSR
jgi:hypothetical protein